ncbi:MAG: alanine--tRNA ligase, partial [Stagnimonas sp.]|nr:alanine--tRNA ligase [Stagnimonas sp.]
DTYGFPLDLTADIARERNLKLDEAGYEREMQAQRTRARAASQFKSGEALRYEGAATQFLGYDGLSIEGAKVLALYRDGAAVQSLAAGDAGVVVLDKTPFYAEGGGQIGDAGHLGVFKVADTQKIMGGAFGHSGSLESDTLKVGDTVTATVESSVRRATMRNHSATHLLHAALRQVLGTHVSQKGSLVNTERTRFDFSHGQAVTADEIAEIEWLVNAEVLANHEVGAKLMSFDDAVASGAMALFGEKYGAEVRVLKMGAFSTELCGGTHVTRTGDIGLFKIVSEGGVAAGVRRIEAVTGENALGFVSELQGKLNTAAAALKTSPADLGNKIGGLLEANKALEKELAALKSKLAAGQGDELLAKAATINGVKVLAAQVETDANGLRTLHDQLKQKLGSGILLLGAASEGKASLIAGVTADLTGKVKAGELVNFVAGQVGGKGGGRPDMAQAGGTQPENLPAAIASVVAWVSAKL